MISYGTTRTQIHRGAVQKPYVPKPKPAPVQPPVITPVSRDKTVTVEGVPFPSVKAAADYLRVPYLGLHEVLERQGKITVRGKMVRYEAR